MKNVVGDATTDIGIKFVLVSYDNWKFLVLPAAKRSKCIWLSYRSYNGWDTATNILRTLLGFCSSKFGLCHKSKRVNIRTISSDGIFRSDHKSNLYKSIIKRE